MTAMRLTQEVNERIAIDTISGRTERFAKQVCAVGILIEGYFNLLVRDGL